MSKVQVENDVNVKNNKRKKTIILLIILVFMLVLIVTLFIVYVMKFIDKRLSNLNYVEIDKSTLLQTTSDENQNNSQDERQEFSEIITIALLGSDSRNVNNMYDGRADSIIIASINPNSKSIKLISIPRDTYVDIPGYGFDKINHAYAFGGEQLLLQTINHNFGTQITEYITVDFLGMSNLINLIGGVDLNISEEEMTIINRYLVEIYSLEGLPYEQMTECGNVTLTGEQAVAHCRNRYVGSDFVRARRQRDVIEAALYKISLASYQDALGYIDYGLSQIKTNTDIKGYWSNIINILINLKTYKSNIISVQIPSLEYGYDSYINGIYYFGADLDRAKQDFYTYIYEK